MTLRRNIIFIILFTLQLSSVQCKLMKWCINSDYKDVNGNIVKKESCKARPCIISICPYNHVILKGKCVKMADLKVDFSEITTIYKMESGKPVSTSLKLDNEHFQIVTYPNRSVIRQSQCTTGFMPPDEYKGYFLENGSFYLLPDTMLNAGEYIVQFRAKNVSGKLYPENLINFLLDDQDDPDEILENRLFCGVMLASCFFIILLLIVYALCKELRNTPGVILMANVATFGVWFLLLTIREFCLIDKVLSSSGCYVLSVLISFFFLKSFCWMSIMSFHIWRTLRMMFYKCSSPRKSIDYRAFARYCCVATVPPTVYTVAEVCLDKYTDNYRVKFSACTVNSSVWHIGAVLLLLLLLNFVLFVMTVYNLYRVQRSTQAQLNNSDSESTGPAKQTAFIIVKLSLMMGINWVMYLLTLFIDDIPYVVNFTAKMYNCLIGIMMFLIYIMKADVLLKVFRKLSINNGITRHLERRVSKSKQHSTRSKSSQQSESTYVVNSQPDPDRCSTPAF